jgi:hypothetical protein
MKEKVLKMRSKEALKKNIPTYFLASILPYFLSIYSLVIPRTKI